jgi:hypothetical protein
MNRDTWVPAVGGVVFAVFIWLFVMLGYLLADFITRL